MTTATKRKTAPKPSSEPGSNVVTLPPIETLEHAPITVTATRPILNTATAYRRQQLYIANEAEGDVDLLDVTEERAEAAYLVEVDRADADRDAEIARANERHRARVDFLTGLREAERRARAKQRAEMTEIATRARAALAVGEQGEGQG
jgi:hypothetical protein